MRIFFFFWGVLLGVLKSLGLKVWVKVYLSINSHNLCVLLISIRTRKMYFASIISIEFNIVMALNFY